jgi:DNA-binding MarR family transcriptional regulator
MLNLNAVPEKVSSSVEQSPCAALRAASRAVTQLYDLVLAPTELKATQFVALHAIDEAGEIAQCQFARDHAVAVETLSRRFSGLRRKGYLQVRRGDRHGERIYSLTEQGRQALQNALPYWERAEDRFRRALGSDGWNTMLLLLDRIRVAAVRAEEMRTNNHAHEQSAS